MISKKFIYLKIIFMIILKRKEQSKPKQNPSRKSKDKKLVGSLTKPERTTSYECIPAIQMAKRTYKRVCAFYEKSRN